ncbi:Uncharacterised protein [Klebsiella pneumoniae]|uniref:DUF6404 family protein n=1 Tax=Klebsiella pneumoniae TaxID=573 RepID=UPI0009C947FC|nr:DUF6404 family protein [Klebsiella pneumoniae]SLY14208.1 Uncharacterised protein [Klebsiella pneumoniae]
MGGKDTSYQVVYRGETLKHFKPGQCVFFQRERQYGGGYWLGKTHVDGFEFLLEQPTSLREGMLFLLTTGRNNVFFGFFMALFHLWRKKVNGLPDWSELD